MSKEAEANSDLSHLRPATAAWVASIRAEFDLESQHDRLLLLAAGAWDRYVEAREAIALNGMTYTDRFGQPRSRPEIAVERDSRTGFAKMVRELALDVGEPEEVRPPEIRGNSKLRAMEG